MRHIVSIDGDAGQHAHQPPPGRERRGREASGRHPDVVVDLRQDQQRPAVDRPVARLAEGEGAQWVDRVLYGEPGDLGQRRLDTRRIPPSCPTAGTTLSHSG